MPKGKRLDLLLEELGLAKSRQAARAAIMDGGVLVNGIKITKPGTPIKEGAQVELTRHWQPQRYVSRGGHKLEKALSEFSISVEKRICLDLGASTGGFTDCLLQHGASKVFAIDVGYGQLDWSLRTDERVIVRERMNARKITTLEIYGQEVPDIFADLAVMDLSFISISKILPASLNCLASNGEVIALIKPQFEAGPELVGKGGVVRSAATHCLVVNSVLEAASNLGLQTAALTFSPLKGPQGNIEFLVHWLRVSEKSHIDADYVQKVVDAAHLSLNTQ